MGKAKFERNKPHVKHRHDWTRLTIGKTTADGGHSMRPGRRGVRAAKPKSYADIDSAPEKKGPVHTINTGARRV